MGGRQADIPEITGVTAASFAAELVPAATPVVLRGLVRDWPLVRTGLGSPAALAAYLRRFDRGEPVSAVYAPPEAGGRIFYNEDLSGFGFTRATARVGEVLDYLLAYARRERPPLLAAQSIPVAAALAGLEAENPMPLLGPEVEPRIWLGNQVTVAAHHDPVENIACVAAGRRRFTLFPPEQVTNLYMGPFELTPAGAAISMVDFDAPDLERHPRFGEALAASMTAELGPGDAIYIPYLWWHHVRSLEPLNVLVNYWWAPPAEGRGEPAEAFFHALLSLRDLPEAHRKAWRAMFDHYVFLDHGPTGEHLPPARRGINAPLDAEGIAYLRDLLGPAAGASS